MPTQPRCPASKSHGAPNDAVPTLSLTPPSARERGFSSLELIITLAIAAALIMVAMMFTQSVSGASQVINQKLQTARTSVDFLAALRHDLNQCRVESISADGATLTYSLPLPVGDDGSTLDRSGEVIWQTTDPDDGSVTKRVITLTFVVDRILVESAVGADVNHDGDMNDSFDIGHLEKTSNIEGQRALPKLYLALRNGNHGGDVTGDAAADPLFRIDAGTLELEFSASRVADEESLKSIISYCGIVENRLL